VRLVYICLSNPGLNVQRVGETRRQRRPSRTHADVARRLANLQIADEAKGYDNTDPIPRKVFEAREGTITWRAVSLPAWADI